MGSQSSAPKNLPDWKGQPRKEYNGSGDRHSCHSIPVNAFMVSVYVSQITAHILGKAILEHHRFSYRCAVEREDLRLTQVMGEQWVGGHQIRCQALAAMHLQTLEVELGVSENQASL